MSKILWKTLLLSPAILGASIAVSSSAIAVEAPVTKDLQYKAASGDLNAAIESQQLRIVNKAESLVAQIERSQPLQ